MAKARKTVSADLKAGEKVCHTFSEHGAIFHSIHYKLENFLAIFGWTQVGVGKIREIVVSGGTMIGISKWFAAAILSTSLIFAGNVAEAKKKHKTHASHVHKKADKKKKKRSAHRGERSEGYTKASRYMEREPASVHHSKKAKKSKHKVAKKKKHRKYSA